VGAGCRQYEEFLLHFDCRQDEELGGSLCDGGSGDPADVGSQWQL
jgi:hypothetical protein